VIGKPGKDDYTKLTEYCTISLLSCIGKVVDKVVAEQMTKEAGRWRLLSNGQFDNGKG
jgi:hypothetical protein